MPNRALLVLAILALFAGLVGAQQTTPRGSSVEVTNFPNSFDITVNGQAPLGEAISATLQNAATTVTPGTLLTVNGYGSAILTVNITGSGDDTVVFEGSQNGALFGELWAVRTGTALPLSTIANSVNTTGNTEWLVNLNGRQFLRANITVCTSCTVTVTARAVFPTTPQFVSIFGLRPDGTNLMPSLDVASRRGYFQLTDGTNSKVVDACESGAKTTTAFSVTADAELVDGNASVITYICALTAVVSAAEIVSIVEGDDGGTCGTNEVALMGSTTDAEGMSFAANGGFDKGDGDSSVIVGKVAAKDVCITLSGTNRVSGSVTWVQR